MAVIFKPTGTLDISTDPSIIKDGDMRRCKNLSLVQNGIAKTRYGISYVSYSGYEEFEDYTEIDTEGWLSVSDHIITLINMDRDALTYIYDDFGANYFGADFEHVFKINLTWSGLGDAYVWALANEVGDLYDIGFGQTKSCMILAAGFSGVRYLQLSIHEGANTQYLTINDINDSTDYYVKIERISSVGVYGTIYFTVYTNSDLSSKLTETQSVALSENTYFRYIYPVSSTNTGNPGGDLSGTVSNLLIKEGPPVYEIVEKSVGSKRYVFGKNRIGSDGDIICYGLTSAQWATMFYNQYNSPVESLFAINGTDRKRIDGSSVFEWGIGPPLTRPVLAAGAATGLTGDYNVKYTYARKIDGVVVSESNPSNPLKNALTLANTRLLITPTAPIDNQVTHYRFYRTLTAGNLYYHDFDAQHVSGDYAYCHSWERDEAYISGDPYSFLTQDAYYKSNDVYSWEIDHETTTSYYYPYVGTSPADNPFIILTFETSLADASLGSEIETDHDRPPLGTYVFGPNYNGTCFILKDNLLYYSKPKQPEYWPATYFIEVSPIQFPLKCGVFHNGQPYVSSANEIYNIQGTGHETFFPFKMQAVTGTKSIRGMVSLHGVGIYHVGTDGVYLYANDIDKKITQIEFEPIFRGQTTNGVPYVNDTEKSWLLSFRNKIYFFYPDSTDTYPSNVLVFDVVTQKATYYSYPYQFSAVTAEDGAERILAGTSTGLVVMLEDSAEITDNTTAISWEIQSKDFTLPTRAHFPRWVKYDVDASHASCVASGELIMDGSTHQTHTITGNRTTTRRLVATGNGKKLSIKISGTGPVNIYNSEGE